MKISAKIWIVAILIFFFAISVRLWNYGDAGRWSDEHGIVEHGYRLIRLIEQKDFFNSYWYTYANDHPPFVYLIYDLAAKKDYIGYDKNEITAHGPRGTGGPVYQYDFTHARIVSIVASALVVLLVFFVGVHYFSFFVGLVAALILACLPHFVGYAHYVDLENVLTLFYSLCIVAYILYLETGKKFFLILTGILIGINLEIKESNILILTFFPITYYVWKKLTKNKKVTYRHFFILGILAFITIFVIWPQIWFHPYEYWSHIWKVWLGPSGLTPDVFFGRAMGAHFYYYFFSAAVTTPLLIIILSLFGLKVSLQKRKKWIYSVLIIWLIVPFFILFFHHRQHMVRYIVQFYVPLSLLAGLGLEYIVNRFTKNNLIKYSVIVPVIAYLMFILASVSPYYLTYFNELVGGTKNVYNNNWFLIGWFGDGLKKPGMFVAKDAPDNARVGIATDPNDPSAVYRIPSLKYEKFDPKKEYDYVIVNYYNVIRIGFDRSMLDKDYEIVYIEKAGGIDYAWVYKRK